MRRCWRREEVQESKGPRVPRSRGPKVPGSKEPRYLKLTFKYELDSKEGPSCFIWLYCKYQSKLSQIFQKLQEFRIMQQNNMQGRKRDHHLHKFTSKIFLLEFCMRAVILLIPMFWQPMPETFSIKNISSFIETMNKCGMCKCKHIGYQSIYLPSICYLDSITNLGQCHFGF